VLQLCDLDKTDVLELGKTGLPGTRFVFLAREGVYFLSEVDNRVYKEAYVDCLALLNDVLVIFGSDPQNPTFPDVEEVIEGLDQATKRLVVDGQDDSVRDEEVESQLKSVHKNANANREVAFTLRKLSTHPDDEGLVYKIRGLGR
jgi:hypothetical protein